MISILVAGLPYLSSIKANILIDQNHHARLADFGLLTIIPDPTNLTASTSYSTAGTTRWMSPELLDPDRFGIEGGRPTKKSDSYALGMVILEVLSGQAPFKPFGKLIVMRLVTDGKRPERPVGPEGGWFTDDLWEMLNLCWETQPESRPGIEEVSKCLGRVSSAWEPLPPHSSEGANIDEEEWDFETASDSSSNVS